MSPKALLIYSLAGLCCVVFGIVLLPFIYIFTVGAFLDFWEIRGTPDFYSLSIVIIAFALWCATDRLYRRKALIVALLVLVLTLVGHYTAPRTGGLQGVRGVVGVQGVK